VFLLDIKSTSPAADVGELEVIQSGAEHDCCFSRGYGAWKERRQRGEDSSCICIQWYIKARVHLTCLLFYGEW